MTALQDEARLNDEDYERWLLALRSRPESPAQFLAWMDGPVRAFLPFERLFCAHGVLKVDQVSLTHRRALGHSPAYLQQLATTFDLRQRRSLAAWLAQRQPFFIDARSAPEQASAFETGEILAFELGNVAAHGILSGKGNSGTYFSFCGVDGTRAAWCLEALRLAVPTLSDLLMAHLDVERPPHLALDGLTPRQQEIARHVVMGHDDKTISRLLGITEKTVRNQLSAIYDALGIHKRTQLIALML